MSLYESTEPSKVGRLLPGQGTLSNPNGTNCVPCGCRCPFFESNDMPNSSHRKQSESRSTTEPEQLDAQHLAGMIRKLNDPLVARIFLEVLNQYPELEKRYLGSYLKAIETIERHQVHYAKAHAVGQVCERLRASIVKAALLAYRTLCFCFAQLRAEMKPSKKSRSKTTSASNDNVIYLSDASNATGTDY